MSENVPTGHLVIIKRKNTYTSVQLQLQNAVGLYYVDCVITQFAYVLFVFNNCPRRQDLMTNLQSETTGQLFSIVLRSENSMAVRSCVFNEVKVSQLNFYTYSTQHENSIIYFLNVPLWIVLTMSLYIVFSLPILKPLSHLHLHCVSYFVSGFEKNQTFCRALVNFRY